MYVPALIRRSNWQTPAEQHLKTGDLVWVVEETNPSGYYPTAWITELVTVPTASRGPPSCARLPDRSFARL